MTDNTARGAVLRPDGTALFRLWSPSADQVVLEIDGDEVTMEPAGDGWREAVHPAHAGSRYCFRLPDGLRVPDPTSRAQAEDVRGPSVVTDPGAYQWKNGNWRGRPWHESIIYELHAGLMGGFDGIRSDLPRLRDLGFTAIEIMPISDFPGNRNWGYDGVLPYAPDNAYGTPDQLKALVDEAHGIGLCVYLDVVYKHLGPDGNCLHAYAEPFFRNDIKTPWGASIDFRREQVRHYFMDNALYWINEFRLDGLRFDAVHAIRDTSFLKDLAHLIRQNTAPGRHVHLILENEENDAELLGPGLFDGQWNDDFHHCIHVLLTGESEGYYADYEDATALLARSLAAGFVYQGDYSKHGDRNRGTPSAHLPTTAFINCLQNHDQIGNRAMGERLTALAKPGHLRAATALLLLAPFVPMVFMGEEWGTKTPFLFFTSHDEELAKLVREGRRSEFKHFAAFQDESRRNLIPDPNAESTFDASRPRRDDPAAEDLYRELLALRRDRIVPGIPGARSAGVDVHGTGALIARWTMGDGQTLAIHVNLGSDPVPIESQGPTLYATEPSLANELPPGHLLATLGP